MRRIDKSSCVKHSFHYSLCCEDYNQIKWPVQYEGGQANHQVDSHEHGKCNDFHHMIVPIKLKLSIGNNNYNNYNNIFNSWHTQMLLYTYNNKRLICILYYMETYLNHTH